MKLLLASLYFCGALAAAPRVLIVADEIPAMEILASHLREMTGATAQIVTQAEMPQSLNSFDTIVVYVHRDLFEAAENAILTRTKAGGKLILLHHSISSGKRKNKEWFPALGVTLPTGKLEDGAYGYYSPASFEVVNLAPGHPVTTDRVQYDRSVDFNGTQRQAFFAPETEIFLNHQLQGERTALLGIRWTDPRSGKLYMQRTAGWHMRLGKGSVFYFMPGHRAEDFRLAPYSRILVNALTY